MRHVELKISLKDWLYIIFVGAMFGGLISMFFYFLIDDLQKVHTIFCSIFTGVLISLISSLLITISNNFILPKVSKSFWYLISFAFSFVSGSLGFLISFYILESLDVEVVAFIAPFVYYIASVVGLLTFLIGLILHKFISMKYANESIKSDILESKIKALENELNPHFLFNALNSTSELVYIDAQKAEEAMMKLSTFLRNAIGNPSLIPLAKELKMVQTYIDIENIRFGNKIRLNIQGEKEVLVPKFSIQLLAENAIKHGFCNDTLVIDIEINEERIVVQNSGKLPKTPLVFGTGLRNLEERLTLLGVGVLEYQIDKTIAFSIVFV